ncbi:hypothetical protein HWD94_10805 [Pseudarthrobacter equi]|uniref:hypothetical protein n=1 Tax=Pseudarthrobacter equi TaxID=728066 RepID=UPI0021C1A389|nr:hypothetical protein [Pseudarthrobacter equi]MCT9625614.1 hypothetical protein [Pseudarthrobacter equi]
MGDDAGRLAKGSGRATELSRVSGQFDDMLKRLPSNSTLSSADRAAVQRAAEQIRMAREIANGLGVSEDVTRLINQDTLDLVKLSRRALTGGMTPTLQRRLESVSQKVLKETTCHLMITYMPRRTTGATAPAAPGTGPYYRPSPSPTVVDVYRNLENKLGSAGQLLTEAKTYFNMVGLAGGLLTKSSGYLTRLKNTMTAVTWENAGAFRVYARLCLGLS